jgi:hypothetical protein
MSDKSFSNELQRALARPDIADLQRQTRVYYEHCQRGFHEETDENADDIDAVCASNFADPEKALAYVILAAANYDDGEYLAFIGAGLLENLLRDPPTDILERIVAEARKTPRFRWLLSVPYRIAIAKSAWDAIKEFRLTPGNAEPLPETLPPGPWS